jgi:hypothetical protein
MSFSVLVPTNQCTTGNYATCTLSIHTTCLDDTSPESTVPSHTETETERVRLRRLSYRELSSVVLQSEETEKPSCQHYQGVILRAPVDHNSSRLSSLPNLEQSSDAWQSFRPVYLSSPFHESRPELN